MNKKAVKIDLSTFFDDERKMTCVLVDPNWKSVECLQKRIEYLFGVESVRFLSDGYFLPPQESIEIVKFCSDLKAFVPKECLEKRKKKKSKKTKTIEKSAEQETSSSDESAKVKSFLKDDSQKKRKFSHRSTEGLTSQAKRSRSSNPLLMEITSTSEQVTVTGELLKSPAKECIEELRSKKSKHKKSKSSIVSSNYAEEHLELAGSQESNKEITMAVNTTNVEENTLVARDSDQPAKKRHTSTPKEKKISECVEEKTFNDEMKTTNARPSSIPSSTFLNESKMLQQQNNAQQSTNSPNTNNPFKKPRSTNRAHIYFNDSGEMVSPSTKTNKKSTTTKEKEPKTIVIFRCPLSDITNGSQKPRIFNLQSKIDTNKQTKKQIVEIQEEIILPPVLINSSPTKEKSVMQDNEKLEESNATTNVVEESNTINEKSSDTSIATDNTTIAKANGEENNLEITQKEDEMKSLEESQIQLTTANESSIMSVDCVDLSMDLDDDEKAVKIKNKRSLRKSKNITEKHDLTKDDEEYDDTSSSDIEEISEIIDLNETEDNCEPSVSNLKAINVHKILPFSTDITDIPAIGDIIVFKVRYVNKKQQYVVSDYIAGKAEYINRRTKSIKFYVLDGVKELNNLPNQYLSNLDESQDCFKYIQIKFNEMIEPKLFASA